jgi:hypothetical protein
MRQETISSQYKTRIPIRLRNIKARSAFRDHPMKASEAEITRRVNPVKTLPLSHPKRAGMSIALGSRPHPKPALRRASLSEPKSEARLALK